MSNNVLEKGLKKLRDRSINQMTNDEAFTHISTLIDESTSSLYSEGADRALYLLGELANRDLSEEEGALREYFVANTWSALAEIRHRGPASFWSSTELQQVLLALSRAANHIGFSKLNVVRQCQILTNQANLLRSVGRIIDAIEIWDAALKIFPRFAMAGGNRGLGLKEYAAMMDSEHDFERAIIAMHAYDSLSSSISDDAFYEYGESDDIKSVFSGHQSSISAVVDIDALRSLKYLDSGYVGRSTKERAYRSWCLDNRLFLCFYNDLGSHQAAATDDLMLPPITESLDDRSERHLPPPIFGFFSQMKQEYVSARFMLYEGISSTKVHFSDRRVELTNTLDYPLYSLASERIRTAFRIAYSLLDKVAVLIDHYWKLNKESDKISFRNVWMLERSKKLLPQFENSSNIPLRGLYWLSKELFDKEIKNTTSADARELYEVRNALEHAYLRVQEGWAKSLNLNGSETSTFGLTIGSDDLERKAVRIMKMARSSLIYVSLAIAEEEENKKSAHHGKITGSMPLYELDYTRKRRDPY